MEDENLSFHWADYLVFGVSLAVSLGIGFFFACYGKKQQSNEEYLMGGRCMNPVAVGLSIAASTLNAVFLIGVPAEIYYYGIIYSLIGVAWLPVVVLAAHVFMPMFRKTEFISSYEYLGHRFNSLPARLAAALTFSFTIILFMAVVLYAPALAFEQVSGLSIHLTQILCGLCCTIYVFMGGLKAVVWTDAVQMMIVICGTVAIAIIGAQKVGGASEVWDIVTTDNRINFDIASADPTVRHTIWSQMIGNIFIWLPIYGGNQMAIQRYHAVATTKAAQISLYVNLFAVWFILAMVVVCGLVMYAYFRHCDPFLVQGRVDRADQLFPLLLMELLGPYPGLAGLYTAAVFAAALSSVSSAVNSLAAVVLEDFIKPLYQHRHGKAIESSNEIKISKGLSLGFGLLTIALSYLAPLMGEEIIQIPMTVWGVVGAPLFGMFILAFFFPCANAVGAIVGLIVSLIFALWLSVGEIMYGRDVKPLMPIGMCLSEGSSEEMFSNMTMAADFTTISTTPAPPPTTEEPDAWADFYNISYTWYGLINTVLCVVIGLDAWADFYNISYTWYGLINTLLCVVIGLVVSVIVDGCSYGCTSKGSSMDGTMVCDVSSNCCCCMSPSIQECIKCGVDFEEETEAENLKDTEKKYQVNGDVEDGIANPGYTNDDVTKF